MLVDGLLFRYREQRDCVEDVSDKRRELCYDCICIVFCFCTRLNMYHVLSVSLQHHCIKQSAYDISSLSAHATTS
jgi:hypothetical protein